MEEVYSIQEPRLARDFSAGKTAEIVPCHPDHIDGVWPTVVPWLERALTFGPDLWTTESLKEQCKKQERLLWLALSPDEIIGFVICTVSEFPKGRVLEVNWNGGKTHYGNLWLDQMFVVMKAWAKQNGCSKMGGGGRRGWLSRFGFREHGVMFILEIEDEQG